MQKKNPGVMAKDPVRFARVGQVPDVPVAAAALATIPAIEMRMTVTTRVRSAKTPVALSHGEAASALESCSMNAAVAMPMSAGANVPTPAGTVADSAE